MLLIGALSLHFLLSIFLCPRLCRVNKRFALKPSLCRFPCVYGSQVSAGGLGGGGCVSRMSPPDPPGMGDKSFQVFSIQTFSCHAALLPFPEPLGSSCSFSVSSPPLSPCLSSG